MQELDFLYEASNNNLRVLCDIIVKDKKGNRRLAEGVSDTTQFKRNYPNNIKAILPQLVSELRLFGGNLFSNLFRGEGPEYSEILRDVAKCLRVGFSIHDTDQKIEERLLFRIFVKSLDNASDEDLSRILGELGYSHTDYSRQETIAILIDTWKSGGIFSFLLLFSVVNAVMELLAGKGLSHVKNKALLAMVPIMLGPVGWTLSALWVVIEIAGPSYSVTIPAVIQIAYIRKLRTFHSQYNNSHNNTKLKNTGNGQKH